METTVKLYSLSYAQAKTYVFALLFIAGNIILPQLCHFVPGGGVTWLPIYFFTLIAGYKYGFRTGLLTAVLSPVVNSLLFGMPSLEVLPVILIKSTLLAVVAAYIANYVKEISILAIVAVVLFYQLIGSLFEWLIIKDLYVSIQHFRMGIPGMLVQIIGGYAVLKAIAKR